MADSTTCQIEDQVPTVGLCAYRGDTFEHHFVWKDEDGVPIDLTLWAARLQVRKSARSSDFLVEVTEASGITLGSEGEIDISIPAASMEIDNESNVYDLEMTDPTNVVTTIVRGPFSITQDVTRTVA